MTKAPVIPLTEYQQGWIRDKSRYKLGVKCRRAGFTFGDTLEDALEMAEVRSKFFFGSRTQDTAKESCREVQRHLRVFQLASQTASEIHEIETGIWFQDMLLTKFYIELPNGSEFHAMTAHPDAMRGFGGNVTLDEFGFHQNSIDLWRAAYAAILRGHRMKVISTPNRKQGKFFSLARDCEGHLGSPPSDAQIRDGAWRWGRKNWSIHWLDIFTAAPQLDAIGVPIDIDEIREMAGDEETFQQEYCCQFLEESEQWIDFELIAAARSQLAFRDWDPERKVSGDLYVGFDVGRRRDLSVIWVREVIPQIGLALPRGVIQMHKTPFAVQRETLYDVLRHPRVRRACIDETGIGAQLAEEAQQRFGYRVEPVTFNLATKEEMSVKLRRRFEERLEKIPDNAPDIERAIAAIKREPTASGALRFDAARSESGHADEYWALALAVHAESAAGQVGPVDYLASSERRASSMLAA